MFRFQNPQYLWLLLIIAALAILFAAAEIIRRRRLKKVGDSNLVKLLIPEASLGRKIAKLTFVCLAIACIIIGLARPQFGSKLSEVTLKGVEIVTALDVSNSMLAEDVKPNRLGNAKMFIERILGKLNGNRLGMVIFAGDAFVQMPITTDVRSARLYLSSTSTDDIAVQGTDIAKAMTLAARSFSSNEEASKVIILMTDGENHEEDAIEVAKSLKEQGIIVMTVGFGSPSGVPIPNKRGNGYMKDNNGNTVMTKLDEQTLVEIAKITGGIYVRASNSSSSSDAILNELNSLQQSETTKQIYSEYDERFQYFVFAALFLLVLEVFLVERKNPLLSKIKLFKKEEKNENNA
ncbi:MAG: VWA domain-containing protein [Bacteroidales bacterium]|nr:VWA domain-containing protein [Bacteroidales bacterium]